MKELAYVIDPVQSSKDKTLTLKVVEAERDSNYLKILDKTRPLFCADLEKLATPVDKPVIATLMQEEIKFQKKNSNIPFNQVHIAYSQSVPLLKLLAATGKVYFNGKQLVIDLFSKTTFEYHVMSVDSSLQVSGIIKHRDQQFNLKECDFICGGSPNWFIKGISLKMIGTDISWKELSALYFNPGDFTAQQIKELEQAHRENPEEPAVVYDDRAEFTLQQKMDPTPILMLKDRTGAFADLWMDYGEKRIPFHHIQKMAAAEKGWEKDLLETDFISKPMANSHYYCPLDKVGKSLTFLLEIGWHIIDFKGNRLHRLTDFNVDFQKAQERIVARGKVSYDAHTVSLTDVVGAFNRRERFVEIAPGSVGLIPDNWENMHLTGLIEDGEIVEDRIVLRGNSFGSLSELMQSKKATLDSSLALLQEKLRSFQGIGQTVPAPDFLGVLRPYQQEGLNWLNFLYDFGFHGILADDMGLGKTVQVLAFLSQLKPESPFLIVLPTSLIFNWQREIERFLPHMPITLHHGADRACALEARTGIVLTSYTLLRMDLALLAKVHWQAVILDEAQMIKNAQTQIAQAVCSLNAKFRLCITGTPIENHLGELWSHFHFLMPDLLGDFSQFMGDVSAAASDARYLAKIKKKIRPFILRRKKEDVAKDLPERIEQIIWTEMPSEQRNIYESFLAGIKSNLIKKIDLEGMAKHKTEVLESILRLRQICCHPLLISQLLPQESFATSGKLEALLQDLETALAEGRKVLVYSQFTSMLRLIAKAIEERSWKYVYLDGSTKDREGVVSQFQNDPEIPLFLLSLKAGGVGLNLTAADYVLLFDPWWNDAVENQAINRAHRIGRKETVIAKRYITIESIEEKIVRLKANKKNLIDGMLDDELGNMDLTEEDLRYLLT